MLLKAMLHKLLNICVCLLSKLNHISKIFYELDCRNIQRISVVSDISDNRSWVLDWETQVQAVHAWDCDIGVACGCACGANAHSHLGPVEVCVLSFVLVCDRI